MTRLESMIDRLAHPTETPRERTARRKAERKAADRRRRNRIAVDKCQKRKKEERRAARKALIHKRNLFLPTDTPEERKRKYNNRASQKCYRGRQRRAAAKRRAEKDARRLAKQQAKLIAEQKKAVLLERRRLKSLNSAHGFAAGFHDLQAGRQPMDIATQRLLYGRNWRRGYAAAFADASIRQAAQQQDSHPNQ
jgi:hypothetical protein